MLGMITGIFQQLGAVAQEPLRVLIELVLVGLVMYWFIAKLEGTRGTRPLRHLLLVLLIVTLAVRVLTVQFDWPRLRILYNYFVVGIAITALIAFQPELRRAFMRVGDVRFSRRRSPTARLISALVKSAGFLSRNKYGGLVAIERSVDLRGWAENGTLMNAEVSANLLNTIFFPNTSLHDLGVIIRENRIVAANCQFPAVESEEIETSLGSRHLAAIGMSDESDALVLVVSEETGAVSLADNGKLHRYLALDDLEQELESRLMSTDGVTSRKAVAKSGASLTWYLVRRLLLVAPLTAIIWFLASQASQVELEVQLELAPEPPVGHIVDILAPQPARFKLVLRGPARRIDRFRPTAGQQSVRVPWPLSEVWAEPGEHIARSAQVIRELATIRAQGLALVGDVQPAEIQFEVDRLVKQRLPVRVAAADIAIADARIVPPSVEVTLRQSDWETLSRDPNGGPAVVVNVGVLAANLAPGDLSAPFDVLVPLRVGAVNVHAIEPESVNVRLQLASPESLERIETLAVNLQVRLDFSPLIWDQFATGQYRLVRVEPLEWLIRELTVKREGGAPELPESVEIDAFVVINGDLLETSGTDVSLDVQFHLPPTMSIAGAPPQVRVRIEESPPGGG